MGNKVKGPMRIQEWGDSIEIEAYGSGRRVLPLYTQIIVIKREGPSTQTLILMNQMTKAWE